MSFKRSLCACCARPVSACICRWITPLSSPVALLILQHPMEVANAKGSARLLHLSVPGSVMVAGEAFDEDTLRALLFEGGRTPVLLYPDTPGAVTPTPDLSAGPGALRLVVLDGTWRKSRKMLHLNRLLQGLPRLPLTDMPASRYRIRKAHAPDQLSTLEAACHALGQLERDVDKFQPLSRAFDAFVDVFVANQGRLGAPLESAAAPQ